MPWILRERTSSIRIAMKGKTSSVRNEILAHVRGCLLISLYQIVLVANHISYISFRIVAHIICQLVWL